jgi:ethanolamine utilization microcompartment shell protein EutS
VNEGVEKLRRIHVVTRKWPGEAAVIAAHLSENDNRGDISFWERAQGVMNLQE